MANTWLTPMVLARGALLVMDNERAARGLYRLRVKSNILAERLFAFEEAFRAGKEFDPKGKRFNAKNALPSGVAGAYESYRGMRARTLPWYDAINDDSGFTVEVSVP